MQRMQVGTAHGDSGQGVRRPTDVVIADDHPVVLDGIAALLEDETGEFRIVARCSDAGAAFQAIRKSRPLVALVKLELEGALDLLARLRRAHIPCGVILFGSEISEDQVLETYRLGARGLLLKTVPTELIAACVRKVARGERWIEQDSADRVIERVAGGAAAEPVDGLTDREREIAENAARGLRNQEIADRLDISIGTVKIHLHNVYRKLGVRGRVQLAALARTSGLGRSR